MVVVLRAEGRRRELLLTLLLWQIAQGAEGTADLLPALLGHGAEFLRRAADLLAAIGREALQIFNTAECALPPLRRHGVELVQAIDQPLLLRLGQAAEAGLLAQRLLLAGEGLAGVALQPSAEVLLIATAEVGRGHGVLVARAGDTRRGATRNRGEGLRSDERPLLHGRRCRWRSRTRIVALGLRGTGGRCLRRRWGVALLRVGLTLRLDRGLDRGLNGGMDAGLQVSAARCRGLIVRSSVMGWRWAGHWTALLRRAGQGFGRE